MIEPERIKILKEGPIQADGQYVLYWMGLAQRAIFNPALEYAASEANTLSLPLAVCYGIAEGFPDVNARHWTFLLEGLTDIADDLAKRGIAFAARREPPVDTALKYAKHAALTVLDRNYLGPAQPFFKRFADQAPCRAVQIEGEVVVPVETTSNKHEYAARTIRPKIHRQWDRFLNPLRKVELKQRADHLDFKSTLDLSDISKLVASLKTDHRVKAVKRFKGGSLQAQRQLKTFLEDHFRKYAAERGKPEAGAASHMSPYLHYGQISPVDIALKVHASHGSDADKESYLEELVVRRELAVNHMHFEPRYATYECLPEWARKTLDQHAKDDRPFLYTKKQFEHGETHDIYWNASMEEMRETGYMHNHLRMYWGKKILEWSASPEEAWETALSLNNKYFIDGRDASSYMNIGWLFGLHDRPWGARPVFGIVRSMSQASLKKFDADAYVKDVRRLSKIEND